MYIILGGDGKEYGPISQEQLTQWIQEGRVNSQTPIKKPEDTQWSTVEAITTAPTNSISTQPHSTAPDIGSCVRRAWELYKAHFWISVLASTCMLVANFIFNIPSMIGGILASILKEMDSLGKWPAMAVELSFSLISTVITLLLSGVIFAGIFWFFLQVIRKQTPDFKNIFAGFSRSFTQLVLGGAVSGVIIALGYFACILPGIYLTVAYIFALPLIIDKGMNFWTAMETSRKFVTRHWWSWAGLILVSTILGCLGILGCGIGILFTLPLTYPILMFAYQDALPQLEATSP